MSNEDKKIPKTEGEVVTALLVAFMILFIGCLAGYLVGLSMGNLQ